MLGFLKNFTPAFLVALTIFGATALVFGTLYSNFERPLLLAVFVATIWGWYFRKE